MPAPQPIIVSYSELDTYRQCPLKHHISYGHRYTKPPKEGGALARGSLYHAVMEEHYRQIKAAQDQRHGKPIPDKAVDKLLEWCFEAVTPMLYDTRSGEQTPDQELIEWMYRGYVEQYGVDQHWKILGIEHQIITPLRDERNRRTRYHLKAKMDLVIADRSLGTRWVVDHKSGRDLPNKMDLEIDDQFGLYTWALREVGKKVQGAIHSANRTQRNKSPMTLESRMGRTYLSRSDAEIRNLALDAYKVAWNAHPPKGRGPKGYSSPDPRSCGWKCDLKEAHLVMRQGRGMHDVLTEFGFKIDKTRH